MSRIVTLEEKNAIVCDKCGDGSLLSEAYLDEWFCLTSGEDLCLSCFNKKGGLKK